MKLIIIGNGFDLAHELKTRFSDFKKSLAINNENDFINRVNEVISANHYDADADYEWNEIEVILYKEFERLKSSEERDKLTDLLDEFSEKFHDYLMNNVVEQSGNIKLIESIKKCFEGEISILNFNYTNLYKNYVDIPKEKVFSIHGNIQDENNNKIVIGYFLNNYDVGSNIPNYKKRFPNKQICKTTNTAKYRLKNLPAEMALFENKISKSIDEIVVIGYSFGESDSHIYELLKKVLKNTSADDIIDKNTYEKLSKIKLTIFEYSNDAEEKKNKLLNELKKRDMHLKVSVTGIGYRLVERELIEYTVVKYK